MGKKIGILGGTFNPIHTAHLYIAEAAKDSLNLDKVMFIPAMHPYHKDNEDLVSFEHRMNMIKEAIADNKDFIASNLEQELNQEKSFTLDVLKKLKSDYPYDEFFFIVGLDSLLNIESWYCFEQLSHYAMFVCFLRNNEASSSDYIQKKMYDLKQKYNMDVLFFSTISLDISSTKIRQFIQKKQAVRYLLPDNVLRYIQKEHLYETR